ncbi:hypothetical protein [Pseudomonas huaxiensis]|uniref:hypothetical protein n=1 Tax=Pseudomonas huaxiensis TaxID=2213017 RepID=UPI000DA652BD|nr:hypothetical protein [Pseudomonas huaxiensis]
MRVKKLGLSCAVALSLTSCTTELVTKPLGTGDPLPTGNPYRMPFTQFDVTVKWQAVACQIPAIGKTPPIKVNISAEATPKVALEPNRLYPIDPRSLTRWMKTGEVVFEWQQNRLLKSVNASADDQAGQVAVNIASGVGKIVSVAFAGAGIDKCDTPLALDIDAVDTAKAGLLVATQDLDARMAVFARVDAAVKAVPGGPSKKLQQAWITAQGQVDAAEAALQAQKNLYEKALRKVTYSYSDTWPHSGTEFATPAPIGLPDPVVKKWGLNRRESGSLQVYFALVSKEEFKPSNPQPPTEGWKGLPYREPALAEFKICSVASCSDPKSEEVTSFDAMVYQLGPMLLLPFEGRAFASNKASASFGEDGALLSGGYSQLRSTAAGASETFKSLSDQVAAVRTAKQGEDLQELEQKTKLYKARKDLADAMKSNNPASDSETQIQALENQTALLEAETKLLEAKKLRDQAASETSL